MSTPRTRRPLIVIDSGCKLTHPHVLGRSVELGPAFGADGAIFEGPSVDRLGHGTAVVGAILDVDPCLDVLVLKVFDERRVASKEAILAALDHAATIERVVVCAALATTDPDWIDPLEVRLGRLSARNSVLVAPAFVMGLPAYPGALPSAIPVVSDPSLDGNEICERVSSGRLFMHASPFPRDLPGLERERNFSGDSFAVARVAAHLATRVS